MKFDGFRSFYLILSEPSSMLFFIFIFLKESFVTSILLYLVKVGVSCRVCLTKSNNNNMATMKILSLKSILDGSVLGTGTLNLT